MAARRPARSQGMPLDNRLNRHDVADDRNRDGAAAASASSDVGRDLSRDLDRLEILSDMSARLLEGQDPDRAVLPSLFESVRADMGLDAALGFTVEAMGDGLQLSFFAGADGEECAADIRHFGFGDDIVGKVACTREALHLSNIQASSNDRHALARSLGVRALACEPVIAGDRLHGVLCFASKEYDRFPAADLLFFQAVARHVALAHDRLQRIAALEECNRELQHRVNNMLSMVQAVSLLSGRSAKDVGDFQVKFGQRLQALARTHNLLTNNDQSAKLRDLLCAELAPYDTRGRLMLRGPSIKLSASNATSAGIAIHELAANAATHGSLALDHGSLSVFWSMRREPGGRRILIHWIEDGGGVADPPTHQGFGSQVLGHTLGSHIQIQREFLPTGMRATIAIALDIG